MSLFAPSIPPSIAESLKNPARRGQFVHEEMLRVVFWMAYEGLDADAIWRVVNAEGGYGRDPEIPRGELERIIDGAVSKFQSGYVPPVQARDANGLPVATPKHKITPELIQRWTENAQKFVEGRTTEVGVVDFLEASPIRFSPQNCQLTLLETLFAENEIVAIKAGEYQDPDEALYVEGWRKKLRMGKRITAKKGAWLRPNPMKLGKPSGKNGTYADADFRCSLWLLGVGRSAPPASAGDACQLYAPYRGDHGLGGEKLPRHCQTEGRDRPRASGVVGFQPRLSQ